MERDDEGLTEDRIFTLLSMGRRRELLRAVDRLGGEATVGDVTNEIVTGEHGTDAGARARKTVYVSLHQTHLPRLVESGALVHDVHEKTVHLTERGDVLLAYLRFDPTAERAGLLSRVLRPGGRNRAK
ncbi:DUF7344 domain-containing protein [Haloarcula salinisoli]|uniref:DUF7344 domain-containing protein n=1 Tax=Haloarcula salinisoli TaxID=2487746 RepID=A0A8J7YLD2_9EURY|nr:hypothetical protein [Halomicroarcula salinisoli]MBX0287553.1 hypothetical protein [Halomicroarcula salinisoli]MBX0304879.1 hypothetical protein [Halomicroarcula salinisoli]